MKILLIKIFKLFLRIIYFFFKLFKTNNKKIVFISRQSNEMTLDFKLIIDSLKEKDDSLVIKCLCMRMEKGIINYIKYFFELLLQMWHVATSKVCVIDSYNIVVCNLKHKKSLFVLQIWHSIGKIKKSGYQTLDTQSGRSKKIALELNMHKNYDKIIAGGSSFNEFYEKSFNVSADKLLNYGLPRIDYLINNEEKVKEKIYEKYPVFKEKKVVLYVPTFRTYDINIDDLINNFDFNNNILIIKWHPNQIIDISDEGVYKCNDFSSTDLLCVSDYVITDYSSICLEAAVLNKKVLFYLFDYDKYMSFNGLNLEPLKVLKSCSFTDIFNILEIIKNDTYDDLSYQEFRKKYLPLELGSSTKKIVDLIFTEINR